MPRKKIIFTEEERKKRNAEAQARWRAKHPEKAKKLRENWLEKVELVAKKESGWRERNPEKIAEHQKKSQMKRRAKQLITEEGVRQQLYKLAWVKEFDEVPRHPRKIANWAGDAIDRVDCKEMGMWLSDRQMVMRARRDSVEFFSASNCGRGAKALYAVQIGWKGWITNPKYLDKLLANFGLEKGDWGDLDWTVPDYWLTRPLRNVLGHDVTKIRFGDKWRGWKINQKELHNWLAVRRCRIEPFVTVDSWGFEIVSGERVVSNYVVEWNGLEVAQEDLNNIVEWVRSVMTGAEAAWQAKKLAEADPSRNDIADEFAKLGGELLNA